jgi:hypothetical protein
MADIIPPAPVDAPFGSYNWADWYVKVRNAINNAGAVSWSTITGRPTTIAGYGITDSLELQAGSGAGASLGTLTNAPSAGNPTWLIVKIGGVTRKLPVW